MNKKTFIEILFEDQTNFKEQQVIQCRKSLQLQEEKITTTNEKKKIFNEPMKVFNLKTNNQFIVSEDKHFKNSQTLEALVQAQQYIHPLPTKVNNMHSNIIKLTHSNALKTDLQEPNIVFQEQIKNIRRQQSKTMKQSGLPFCIKIGRTPLSSKQSCTLQVDNYKQNQFLSKGPSRKSYLLAKNIVPVPLKTIKNGVIQGKKPNDSSQGIQPKDQLSTIIVNQIPNKTQKLNSTSKIKFPRPKLTIARPQKKATFFPQNINSDKQKNMQMLEIRRKINKDYAKPFQPPSNVSAQAYIVYEQQQNSKSTLLINRKNKFPNSHKIIISLNCRTSMEIASLTKIMTCLVALEMCENFNIDVQAEQIKIGGFESSIEGTSAEIRKGQIYTLQQLLYGLMLPSGNDASLAIAVWGGRLLFKSQLQEDEVHTKKECYDRYIVQMNQKAIKVGLDRTSYANTHGLSNADNKSCAYDIAILVELALKNKKFREIVSSKEYECTVFAFANAVKPAKKIKFQSNNKVIQRKIRWENTHKLLRNKPNLYAGVKTGITNTAGPCLASLVISNNQRNFIIVVLNCKSVKNRFKDTEILRKWLFEHEKMLEPQLPQLFQQN